jgi:hypothetical protein
MFFVPLHSSSVQQQTSLQSALDLDSVDAASFASGLVIADSPRQSCRS